jgi:hypothetical protein
MQGERMAGEFRNVANSLRGRHQADQYGRAIDAGLTANRDAAQQAGMLQLQSQQQVAEAERQAGERRTNQMFQVLGGGMNALGTGIATDVAAAQDGGKEASVGDFGASNPTKAGKLNGQAPYEFNAGLAEAKVNPLQVVDETRQPLNRGNMNEALAVQNLNAIEQEGQSALGAQEPPLSQQLVGPVPNPADQMSAPQLQMPSTSFPAPSLGTPQLQNPFVPAGTANITDGGAALLNGQNPIQASVTNRLMAKSAWS